MKNVWGTEILEVYTVGRVCYFNLKFSNGLNPSKDVENFASGFPAPIGKNITGVALDYDNNISFTSIPYNITIDGDFLVSKSVEFRHTIMCTGSYLIK